MKHTRWDIEHREICGECYQEWLDEAREMELDAAMEATECL